MMTIFPVMLLLIFALILHFTHVNYIDSSTQLMRSVAMQPFVPDLPDGYKGLFAFSPLLLKSACPCEYARGFAPCVFYLTSRHNYVINIWQI